MQLNSTYVRHKLKGGTTSSSEHLDDAVAARGNDEAPILAPHDAAHALAAHDAVCRNFLCADALVERPEADRGIVPCGDGFAAVFADGEGGDGGGVGEHVVGALT